MYSSLMKTLNATDGRYLTPDEEKQVLGYAQTLPKRLELARIIEKHEREIVDGAVEKMRVAYPRFTQYHQLAWEKTFRDMQLVLRYNIQGLLMDDIEVGPEKLFYWLRTIVASFHITPQCMRDAYTFLREGVRKHVSADGFELLEPYLNRTIEVMSDFPEPATPAV